MLTVALTEVSNTCGRLVGEVVENRVEEMDRRVIVNAQEEYSLRIIF